MIQLVITLIVIGVLLYLEEKFIPMDDQIKKIIRVIVLICVIVLCLYAFGVLPLGNHDIPVPKLR